jgi:hypothetical protein
VGTLTTMAPEILKGSNYNEKAGTLLLQVVINRSVVEAPNSL